MINYVSMQGFTVVVGSDEVFNLRLELIVIFIVDWSEDYLQIDFFHPTNSILLKWNYLKAGSNNREAEAAKYFTQKLTGERL